MAEENKIETNKMGHKDNLLERLEQASNEINSIKNYSNRVFVYDIT